ncbi:D-2-hydroxyacid dehydrogenase [Sphaerisporangium flaviroseum]|uniref:D-2-hydroxyacid dehydrogenase n=1 Tax=Sphaerisporangium flaviroseum TaxID=509199 RepID=A0ABP7IZH7_9ACTN
MSSRPRVVWVDEPTVLPAEFLARVREFCEFNVMNGMPGPDEVVRRLRGAEIAVAEWTLFDEGLISRLGSVRYLCLVTTAADYVDVEAARRHGIVVTNCPSYSAASVAEYVIGALIVADRAMNASNAEAKLGRSHVYHPFLGRGLEKSTLGLVGVGTIGRQIAKRAAALGMTVLGCNRSGGPVPGVKIASLEQVLRSADYVSIQVPYSAATHHLISGAELDLLARHAILANVSRARVLDEQALADRLASGRIRGAILDDVSDPVRSRLVSLPAALVTTGIAWFTEHAIHRNFNELEQTLRSCVADAPINVVDP